MLGAGIDSLWLPELPAAVAIFLMLRLAGAEDEFQEKTTLEVRVVDPAREETQALSIEFSSQEMPPLKVPGLEAGMLIPALIQWEVRDYGLCTLEVFVDGQRQRSIGIAARDPSELETPEPG
jgi:hypothetical protein